MNSICKYFSVLLQLIFMVSPVSHAGDWKSLQTDGIHDPDNPGLEVMQQPADALASLPADVVGNQVRWVQALRDSYISPRTNVLPETEVQLLELDIIMQKTGDEAYVRFPHLPHTEWLDCSNCHDKIFPAKAGATPMTMLDILMGEYCGRCHGAVAFPLTECNRCHSVNPDAYGLKNAK